MLLNYIKIALRNIRRQRIYSLINLLGLAVGLACALLITLYVRYELSYDRFYERFDDLYRLVGYDRTLAGFLGDENWSNSTCGLLAPTLKHTFPEIENAARVRPLKTIVAARTQVLADQSVYLVDDSFLRMFDFPALLGNSESALSQPNSIAISSSLAERLFGHADPLGKTIRLDDRHDVTVTAVLQQIPGNTHFDFDALASFDLMYARKERKYIDGWTSQYFKTYLQLVPGTDIQTLRDKLPAFVNTYRGDPENNLLRLEPVAAIHLHGHNNFELTENSDVRYLYFYTSIAFFILLIACFNYVNLFTARATLRHREIGVRKLLGAQQGQLKMQFLSEVIILALLSFVIAIILALLVLPVFNQLIDRQLTFDILGGVSFWSTVIAGVILTGILTGSYPAFRLAQLEGVKGWSNSRDKHFFRDALVVVQFIVSLVLIVAALVINKQLDFIRTSELGFDRSQVLTVNVRDEKLKDNFQNLATELARLPEVSGVTVSHDLPTLMESAGQCNLVIAGQSGSLHTYLTSVDHEFLDFYNIKLVQGRAFSPAISSDLEQAYLVNEAFLDKAGLQEPLDKPINFGPMDEHGFIIGVIQDFNFLPLQMEIEPLVLRLNDRRGSLAEGIQYFSIRLDGTNLPGTVKKIQNLFIAFSPGYPFEYAFLDERFDKMYRSEQKMQRLFVSFTVLALLISGLGLFGLAAFSTSQRFREIAIRKVLGAGELGILLKTSAEFLRLILLAAVIALPLAWYAMERWLDNFSYRTAVGSDTLVTALLAVLTLGWLAVGYQSLRAARTDPVKILKHE